ncbi:acyl-CoA carboxylase subunit beta [Amycolatopsis saalfeldensis]|uniref:Acetyl-CoA carboxylase, carboxyltransferase component n=1 Tax=Amycolatopsis saalfeldensis TaxID=394193 RepID=A0A1H8XD06_9PSEU|nr:carboxyl transferase domain-containing protein [Amycolatopsis saalfeldensis]SEP37756.1 Acetyl-CoA carboxylase, carboxyltransferase component [Amycolatopsis saalfeldensis]
MTIDYELRHEERRAHALGMGGERKLTARAERGELNARERVARLFDDDSFRETGLFATSNVDADQHATPADGKVTGTGLVDGRRAGAIAYDFTVKGASSGAVSNKKMGHLKDLTARTGMPLVYLAESTGVRMPDVMGGTGLGNADDRARFLRRRTNPWASAVFGYSFGSAAWHTVSSDFAVLRKGAVMAVSSPQLVGRATGQQVDGQELGGWKLHSEVTGFADAVAATDEEAIALVRRFLSYLPAHNGEAPPVAPIPEGSAARGSRLHDIVPPERTNVYDMRKVIEVVADLGSVFPIKERYGKSLVTSLCRIGGQSAGIIASNPMFKGGAIDAAACAKATSFIVLCDSYNIPLVFLVDQPGFLIGLDGERGGIVGKVINWMNALSLATVPKVTVMLRKNYGQGYVNMGGAWTTDAAAAWWSAEVSFMDPRSAVGVVHGIDPAADPRLYERKLAEMAKDSTGYDVARVYGVQDVIDPADTREFILGALEDNALTRTGGVGEHHLSTWPTSY